MGKEFMARLSRRLWGGTSLKTAVKEAISTLVLVLFQLLGRLFIGCLYA